ncbi:hypothetical protein OAD42_05520 [Oceanospirillaceae bacterium]|nr:hypothetical protein [Oceanospirillaceae bacterium]
MAYKQSRTYAYLFALLVCGVGVAEAESSEQQSTDAVAQRPNLVTSAAVSKGVLSCADRVENVTNFLGFGPQAGALLMAAPQQPNKSIVSVVMEIPITQTITGYVSSNFAPNQANGCGASYDAVIYWPETCEQIQAKQFSSLDSIGLLKQNIVVLNGGTATKVFLMPAGVGCVSIKKERVL